MTPLDATSAFRVSKPKARGAIQQNDSKCGKFRQGIQGISQPKLAFLGWDEFDFGAGQISIGSEQPQVGHGGRANRLITEIPVHQKIVGSAVPLGAGYTQSGRGIALWVHVDEQDGQVRQWTSAAARLTAVVVLPTPPFWFATARTSGFVMISPQ